jgi:hypothetical protein
LFVILNVENNVAALLMDKDRQWMMMMMNQVISLLTCVVAVIDTTKDGTLEQLKLTSRP